MNSKPLPTIERIRELLTLDLHTGALRWLISRRGAKAGSYAAAAKKHWGEYAYQVDVG